MNDLNIQLNNTNIYSDLNYIYYKNLEINLFSDNYILI